MRGNRTGAGGLLAVDRAGGGDVAALVGRSGDLRSAGCSRTRARRLRTVGSLSDHVTFSSTATEWRSPGAHVGLRLCCTDGSHAVHGGLIRLHHHRMVRVHSPTARGRSAPGGTVPGPRVVRRAYIRNGPRLSGRTRWPRRPAGIESGTTIPARPRAVV